MILIISINYDQLTSKICMWLLHNNAKFKILTGEDIVRLIKIKNDSMILKNITRDYEIDLKNVTKILYRQGDISIFPNIEEDEDVNLTNFLNRENTITRQLFYHKIKQIDHLGHPQLADLNKLILLEKAKKIKLLVPNYIFTTLKTDVLAFYSKHSDIITKTILPSYTFEKEGYNYFSYTELISQLDIKRLDTNFHPTFFQRLIPKKIDIRVFYLDNEFYSIAIISQNNSNTTIDSRNYDRKLPNRQIPFLLPKSLKNKLQNLISDINLKYCSIDLIYGTDKQFYFLEINPIGQFGNVSYFGNYHLEKKMAEILCV